MHGYFLVLMLLEMVRSETKPHFELKRFSE